MKLFTIVFFVTLSIPKIALCLDSTIIAARYYDFGIVGFQTKKIIDDITIRSKKRVIAKKIFIKESIDKIPIESGLAYAIKYELRGQYEDKKISLNVIQYSEGGLCKNTKTGEVIYKNNSIWEREIGKIYHNGGMFRKDDPCPDTPGKRTIEIWHGNNLLLTKEFLLYKK